MNIFMSQLWVNPTRQGQKCYFVVYLKIPTSQILKVVKYRLYRVSAKKATIFFDNQIQVSEKRIILKSILNTSQKTKSYFKVFEYASYLKTKKKCFFWACCIHFDRLTFTGLPYFHPSET